MSARTDRERLPLLGALAGDVSVRLGAVAEQLRRAWRALAAAPPLLPTELPMVQRVRLASGLSVVGGAVFSTLEGHLADPHAWSVLTTLALVHAVVASGILLATRSRRARRHADGLAVALVACQVVMIHFAARYWPGYPGLTAGLAICLLVGNALIFVWGPARTLVLGVVVCGDVALSAAQLEPGLGENPRFGLALFTLLLGASVSFACSFLHARLRAGLAERQAELTALSSRLMSLQEEERRRLSRELHDEFGQSLTAAMAHLWLVDRQVPQELTAVRRPVAEVRRLMAQTLGAMREMSQLLRPGILDQLGLVPSLEALVTTFQTHHEVETSFHADDFAGRLGPEIETALYRVAQEALTNVARHAHASHVAVRLEVTGEEIRLEVVDDGVGLPRVRTGDGIGLIGMRERMRSLGGTLVISGRGGTRVEARVPVGAGSSASGTVAAA